MSEDGGGGGLRPKRVCTKTGQITCSSRKFQFLQLYVVVGVGVGAVAAPPPMKMWARVCVCVCEGGGVHAGAIATSVSLVSLCCL